MQTHDARKSVAGLFTGTLALVGLLGCTDGAPPDTPGTPVPVVAIAEEEPPAPILERTLSLQREESWNEHHAGPGYTGGTRYTGGSSRRSSASVVARLYDTGLIRIRDKGERNDRNSRGENTTIETREWDNEWQGSWREEAGALILELSRGKRSCTETIAHTRNGSGSEPVSTTCQAASESVELRCSSKPINLAGADHKAWYCGFSGKGRDLGGTPTAWVFGKEICVKVSAAPRGRGRSFSPCSDD